MKPGEARILKALMDGPAKFGALKERASVTNPTARSMYLKNLQNRGLIMRDFNDERRYKLVPLGWEMLFLKDLEAFISERIESVGADGLLAGGLFLQPPMILVASPNHDGLVPFKDFAVKMEEASEEIYEAMLKVQRAWALEGFSERENARARTPKMICLIPAGFQRYKDKSKELIDA